MEEGQGVLMIRRTWPAVSDITLWVSFPPSLTACMRLLISLDYPCLGERSAGIQREECCGRGGDAPDHDPCYSQTRPAPPHTAASLVRPDQSLGRVAWARLLTDPSGHWASFSQRPYPPHTLFLESTSLPNIMASSSSSQPLRDPLLHDPSIIYAPSPSLSRSQTGMPTNQKGNSKTLLIGRSSFGRSVALDGSQARSPSTR